MGGSEDSGMSGLADMTFGSIAGMTAKVFEHPFDLIKVRLQSQPTDRPLSFTGPLDCFKQTYRKEGIRGLYRGISAPILGAAAENACLFLVYNKCQEAIYYFNPGESELSAKARGKRRELSMGELALAAAGAGAATSFVLTPIELIKCRMQVQMLAREGAFGPVASAAATSPSPSPQPLGKPRQFHTSAITRQRLHDPSARLPPPAGPLSLIMDTVRTGGLRGLWLGQLGTLFRETGGSSAWFTTYELASRYFLSLRQRQSADITKKFTKADLATHELMISGAMAGVAYNVILFPADSIKSSMQTWAELNPSMPKPSFGAAAAQIWKTRGIRGMYAGLGITVMRSAPSSAMIFLLYEKLEKRFGYLFGV